MSFWIKIETRKIFADVQEVHRFLSFAIGAELSASKTRPENLA
jgi:hypothetical protein